MSGRNGESLRLSRRALLATAAAGSLGTFLAPARAATPQTPSRQKQLADIRTRLVPIQKQLGEPQPGEWLSQHNETPQTFEQYVATKPVTAWGRRKRLYVQPLGDFSQAEEETLGLTVEYLALYFGLETQQNQPLPLESIPASARRIHPRWNVPQILSTHVLDKVLPRLVVEDAAAVLCLTTSDLWPGRGWNFVFGQASLQRRVGVWSTARFGDAAAGATEKQVYLERTIGVASHETGHMFSLPHCALYECNMNGSNSLEESDRQPSWLCAECEAKLAWATQYDVVQRFAKLHEFCEKHALKSESRRYAESLERLQ